jgi:hypothetical protein
MTSDTDEPEVPIVCTECETESRVPLSELADMLDTHNENQHDGEQCAQVDPDLADQLQDIVAEDMGLLD